jgi:hypothetical protein
MLYDAENTTKISRFQTLREPLQRGVNIVTRPKDGKLRNHGAILGTGDGFCLLQRVQAGCGTHSALIKWLAGVYRRLGQNLITHFHIVARLKMCGAIFPLCFHVREQDTFTCRNLVNNLHKFPSYWPPCSPRFILLTYKIVWKSS